MLLLAYRKRQNRDTRERGDNNMTLQSRSRTNSKVIMILFLLNDVPFKQVDNPLYTTNDKRKGYT
jgi:hypothetical protein